MIILFIEILIEFAIFKASFMLFKDLKLVVIVKHFIVDYFIAMLLVFEIKVIINLDHFKL
jgi:hypothetical protein